jgi:hypothetical protein
MILFSMIFTPVAGWTGAKQSIVPDFFKKIIIFIDNREMIECHRRFTGQVMLCPFNPDSIKWNRKHNRLEKKTKIFFNV